MTAWGWCASHHSAFTSGSTAIQSRSPANGIQNAIFHAWRITPIEDLTKYYTARVNYETGVPTPMEFIYYYKDKVKTMI